MRFNRNAITFVIAIVLVGGAFILRNTGILPSHSNTQPTLSAGSNTPVGLVSAYGLHLPPLGKKVAAPPGRQVYEISEGGNPSPAIAETVIDPAAVYVGDMQHLEVLVANPDTVSHVYVVSRLDAKEVKFPLALVGKEMRSGQAYGRYSADWNVTDTHDALYMTAFFAEDTAGHVNHVEHAWSDPASPCINVSGNVALTSSCTISSLDGVQGGNLIVNAGVTLALNAEFDYTSGNSITLGNTAIIAIGGGGSLKKKTIYMQDSDGDHWPADGSQYNSLAACTAAKGAGCVARATLVTWGPDCNDNDAAKTNNCATHYSCSGSGGSCAVDQNGPYVLVDCGGNCGGSGCNAEVFSPGCEGTPCAVGPACPVVGKCWPDQFFNDPQCGNGQICVTYSANEAGLWDVNGTCVGDPSSCATQDCTDLH